MFYPAPIYFMRMGKKTCNLKTGMVNYQGIPHGSGFNVMCFSREKWA
jgi:hypothetical protein